jgi:hypothetical protein
MALLVCPEVARRQLAAEIPPPVPAPEPVTPAPEPVTPAPGPGPVVAPAPNCRTPYRMATAVGCIRCTVLLPHAISGW